MSVSPCERARKRAASPGLLEPEAQRRHNPVTASHHAVIPTPLPVSPAEHKERIAAFAKHTLERLLRRFNKDYVDAMMDLESPSLSNSDLWEALSFIYIIWHVQVAYSHLMAELVADKGEQADMPSSAGWYRRWLDKNSPQYLMPVPEQPRWRATALTASSLASFSRQQKEQ